MVFNATFNNISIISWGLFKKIKQKPRDIYIRWKWKNMFVRYECLSKELKENLDKDEEISLGFQ